MPNLVLVIVLGVVVWSSEKLALVCTCWDSWMFAVHLLLDKGLFN